jgi:pimeloyl-ACP methyl ester carboxylesterase
MGEGNQARSLIVARRTSAMASHVGADYLFDVPRSDAVRLRAWPLVAVAVLFECLAASGVVPAQASLVHEVALPPLDLSADMGLLVARTRSPVWFTLGVVLAVTGRTVVLAFTMGTLRRWRTALRFELLALVPSFVGAELCYSGQSVLYSALFWVGTGVIVLGAILLGHVPWQQPQRLRSTLAKGLLHGMRAPTVITYLIVLAILSALVRDGGGAAAGVGVLVSLILTMWFARRLTEPGRSAWTSRLGALVVVVAVVGISILVRTTPPSPRPDAQHGELVVVSGMDSSTGHGGVFPLNPRLFGFSCRQVHYFSYVSRGTGAPTGQAMCPITSGAPYERRDTERSLALEVTTFRAQVDDLRPPVTVVAHSSGGFVAWAAVHDDPHTPVRRLVLLGPVEGSLGYPAAGRPGPGTVGASGMRLVTEIGRKVGFSEFDADRPLARQMLGEQMGTAVYRQSLPPDVHALAVPAATDMVLFNTARPFPRAQLACPLEVSHGHIASSSAAADVVDRFLSGRPPTTCRPWQSWLTDIGWGFRVP